VILTIDEWLVPITREAFGGEVAVHEIGKRKEEVRS
jgi:hypothetical protein